MSEKTDKPAKSPAESSDTASSSAGGESEAKPSSSYSRGEKQKPTTDAYRNGWDQIFRGKKKNRSRK